jgi:hypothetical protein
MFPSRSIRELLANGQTESNPLGREVTPRTGIVDVVTQGLGGASNLLRPSKLNAATLHGLRRDTLSGYEAIRYFA